MGSVDEHRHDLHGRRKLSPGFSALQITTDHEVVHGSQVNFYHGPGELQLQRSNLFRDEGFDVEMLLVW
jgi:hypothetical protein